MLQDDYELSRGDIQDLSNRDALAAFFAKLGYNTNERLIQHTAAMSFGSEVLKSAITHIERLASEDGGLLEVYLVELKSVTVAVTRALALAFRNLSVLHPLLVLTDDYQRLDFVLVERYTASTLQESANPGLPAPMTRQVGVRPRVLTVNRLKPGDVELRVLRRFSYTESDSLAQYDKLLSAYDVADWSEPFFNNRTLFSDYYLTQRLPESPEWKNPAEAAAMTRAYRALRDLYADVREAFTNQPGTAVRAKLLTPAFEALGFTVQPARVENHDAIKPGYRLHATPTPGLLALCLAYTWDRNLDGKDDLRDSETPDENPGAVVVSLLDRGEADWAIVTNGKIWRLYSAKAHSRATNYYEIDLEETLAQPPEHRELAFRYFWYFFRATAFQISERTIDGEKRQVCFLDGLVSDSERYARELGERLKERVFFEIFPHFARGFILYARRTGQLPASLDTLPDEERSRLLEPFFSGTLTFLYRLLFLLYAESRDLLPVREVRGYYEKSLEKLKREIAAKAGPIEDQAPALLTTAYNELSTALYDRLQVLFHTVDKGDADLNVPVYNGGLFITQPDPSDTSPEAAVARFLANCKIPDRQLALGLDRMARDLDEKRQDLAFIDYKSLGVRQLGSIYEGLLEFKLRIAPEEMAVVRGKKTEEVVPYAEAQQKKLTIVREGRGKDAREKTLPNGAVYLENDRRERKATGSYYTPDYIVKYIVEHTVGPVLNEKLEALRPIFREAEKTLRAERDKVKALRREEISAEHETYKKFRKTLNDAFFDLRVLDPAMGSGHFLVEAVDHITDRMADFLTAFRWNPVVYELAQTRREIQAEMERQNITIDMSKLTDLNLLKRRVLKSCIYGVDLNPMAVELAKVSLWLDCFTLGAPLSFLDHHMKCGNSLIGGSVQEVQDVLSTGLWSNQLTYLLDATQLMRKVGELSDVTAQEVIESRKAYQGAYDALAPFKRLLDVYISEYFGNRGAKHTTRLYAAAIVANDYSRANPDDQKAIETALSLARAKRFFHWELEFPEVFFDERQRKDNGGFDAVVGNPPYVSAPSMVSSMPAERRFLDGQYRLLTMKWDLYCAFIELGCRELEKGGAIGFIIPSQVLYQDYAKLIRKELVDKYAIELIADFSGVRVFPDATVMTCVIIARKLSVLQNNHLIKILKLSAESVYTPESFLISNHRLLSQSALSKTADVTFRLEASSLAIVDLGTKITYNSYDLGHICYGSVGVVPHSEKQGKPKEYYIYSYKHDAKCKPYIEGKEVDRYNISWQGRFLQYDYNVVRRPSLPELLESDKIILKIVAGKSGLNATIDYSGFYGDHSFVMFTQKYRLTNVQTRTLLLDREGIELSRSYQLEFLLAIINSSLMGWYFQRNLTSNLNIGPDDVKKLPIRRINFTLSPEQRVYYLTKAKNLYEYCLDKNDQACVLGFVEHHLSKEPEESDVVHDLLAFLAEEMIRLNKEKRAAQREFLDWLVATLRILPDKEGRKGIDVLTGKAKLADYPGDYQKGEPPLSTDELLEILRKNRSRLGVSLSDAGLVDRIKKIYEESLQRVLPIKERLEKTDALIDQVVYRLYGLTEEEIRVVEGKV